MNVCKQRFATKHLIIYFQFKFICQMSFSLREKIFRRGGHLAFEYKDRMFIWGGFTERVPEVCNYIG